MTMGGLMKGHHHVNNSGSRGKSYGLMILMAFGAAILGVMVLHKFRERRIFNLLVKEKDRQITTLHLLLQKERDHVREAKWKLEEMKTKVSTLRTQKRGLDSRIVEMQSTISSLREEQRAIELALDDRQNEIKLMRDRYTEVSNHNPQVKFLSEMSRQKEYEVEDLKNHIETPVKVWSVSTDDPSNGSINLHSKMSLTQRDGTNINEGNEVTAELYGSTNNKVADNSSEHADKGNNQSAHNKNEEYGVQGEHTGGNGGEDVESGEQIQEVDNSKESISGHRNTYLGERTNKAEGKNIDKSQIGEALGMRENNNSAKAEAVVNHDTELQQPRDIIDEGQTAEDKVLQAKGIGLQVGNSNAQGAENKKSGGNYNGGMKLEMPDFPQIRRHRMKGSGYLKKSRRKRSNIIDRSKESRRNSVSNGAVDTRDKSFSQVTLEGERDKYGHQRELGRKERKESLTIVHESGSDDHDEVVSDNHQTGESSKLEIKEQIGSVDGEVQEDSGWERPENNTEGSKDSPEGNGLAKSNNYQYFEDLSQEDRNITTYSITERQIAKDTSIINELEHISLKNTPSTTTIHIEDETPYEAKQQNQSKPEEKQGTDFQQLEERVHDHKEDKVSEQTQTLDNDVEPENPEMEDVEETDSDADVSKESVLNSEADGN